MAESRTLKSILLLWCWFCSLSVLHGGLKEELRDWVEEHLPNLEKESRERFGLSMDVRGSWEPPRDLHGKEVVLLVHGLDEAGGIWSTLVEFWDRPEPLLRLVYPNDQRVVKSALFLGEILDQLAQQGVTRCHIVAHSMGGLVAREFLSTTPSPLPIGHFIMVGTPNHGSEFAKARMVTEIKEQMVLLFKGEANLPDALTDGLGEAGEDLLPGSEFLTALNARTMPEEIEVSVIAGRIDHKGQALFKRSLEGIDAPEGVRDMLETIEKKWDETSDLVGDGVVPIASARLEEADFEVIVPGNHRSMLDNVFISNEEPPAVTWILSILSGGILDGE